MTTIIIYYSRKLVFFIDALLQTSLDDTTIVCKECGEEFRLKIIKQMSRDNCVSCGHPFDEQDMAQRQNNEVTYDRPKYRSNERF